MKRRLVAVLGLLVAACACGHSRALAVQQIAFEVERAPDGAKYPTQVIESYSLGAGGRLDYFAYFAMPLQMNHTDRVRWESREAGAKVLALAGALLGGAAAQPVADSQPPSSEPEQYKVELASDGATSTFVVVRGSPAFARLDAAFRDLIAKFESANGRPLLPGDLPQ